MASIFNALYPSYGSTASNENSVAVEIKESQNSENASQALHRLRLKELGYKIAFSSSLASFFIFQTVCSNHVYQLNPINQNPDTESQKIMKIFVSGVMGFVTGSVIDYYETYKPYAARTFKNIAYITVPAIAINSIRYGLQCPDDPDLAKCELDTLLLSQINTMLAVSGVVALKTMRLAWPFKRTEGTS